MIQFLLHAVSALFQQSLVIAMPVMGTLFIISVAMGLLSKAAPQMNLLTEGFPISLAVTYILMIVSLPFMMEAFSRIIGSSFNDLGVLVGGSDDAERKRSDRMSGPQRKEPYRHRQKTQRRRASPRCMQSGFNHTLECCGQRRKDAKSAQAEMYNLSLREPSRLCAFV